MQKQLMGIFKTQIVFHYDGGTTEEFHPTR
jgi:hypothetical protein